MNITYLIGNGFDIALGLNTRYSDFIDYYCKLNKAGRPHLEKLQKMMGKQDPETKKFWSNAERAFGELDWTAFAAPDDPVEVFRECLKDVQIELENYLKSEERRVRVPEEKAGVLAQHLFSRMVCLDRYMSPVHGSNYREYVKQHNNHITLNFIVFNYTDTIERLWMGLQTDGNSGARTCSADLGGRVTLSVTHPCFVHGVFSRQWFMFGVDNPAQIRDQKIRAECEASGRLIKPYMDEDSGFGYMARAKKLLSSSETIVTYGLSLGSSDQMWSDMLYQQLFNNHRLLVICPYYDEGRVPYHAGEAQMINLRTAVRNLFAPLAEAKKLEVDVSRKKLGSVRLLDEEWAGVKSPKCDYFDLEFINKEIVLKGGHHGQ